MALATVAPAETASCIIVRFPVERVRPSWATPGDVESFNRARELLPHCTTAQIWDLVKDVCQRTA